jgi:mono/diheme cytochrome c family protein/uncharacterized membrane protein
VEGKALGERALPQAVRKSMSERRMDGIGFIKGRGFRPGRLEGGCQPGDSRVLFHLSQKLIFAEISLAGFFPSCTFRASWFNHSMNPTFVKPRYDSGGFAGLPVAIQSIFSGGKPFHQFQGEYDNVILCFIDGFGWRHFEKFGGLAYFLFGLLALRKLESVLQTRLVSLTVQKFSAMALGSVALIGLTGLYAVSLRIGTLQALTTTLYGYSMLVKQGFVGLLMVIAAGNLLVISPRLNRNRISGTSNAGLVKRFTLMVFAESLLAVFLLLSVSYLTYLPPAKANPAEIGLSASAQADDLSMDLSITPGVIGLNTFNLELKSNGQSLLSAKEVLLRFTALNKNIPPSDVALITKGNGQYSANGANLSLPADWKVEVIVRRDQKFDVFASFQFALAGVGGSLDSTPQIAGGLLALDGLLFALAIFSLGGKNILKFGVSGPLTLILVVGGAFLLIRPGTPTRQVNPIPASSQSTQAGAKLFSNYCVACHGEMGMGDGPLAKNLNPKPADLMAQGAPGVHTDEELFGWISNGFPGSAMPGFKTSLSETDRWNLVNFIRTLSG